LPCIEKRVYLVERQRLVTRHAAISGERQWVTAGLRRPPDEATCPARSSG